MSTPEPKSTEHIDVRYVARLARLHLSEEEVNTFQAQLDDVLAYVDQLKELDVEGIEPTAHAIPVENVLREDVVRPSLDHDAVMANFPATFGDEVRVPKIVE